MNYKKLFVILTLGMFIFACTPNRTDIKRKPSIDYSEYESINYEGEFNAVEESEDGDFVGQSSLSSRNIYGDAVVIVASKKITLGRRASSKEMGLFQASLDKAYLESKRAFNPQGFTFSMSPAGAINPLSDIEVQCILSQESANDVGQKTCDLFFKSLRTEYALALESAE
ncbi:hypothetical protein Emin_1164 [Elusimicrobium minutum Pei191]|uniref:Lipoprotein n=1 Tax=Elusimicrobium minutum (strain Pei191) TaxID=445932 RepID=B2KDX0_ELUMP|nr:hypothetical protein [Elusimicrobium minutum]ACC98716.1 hypothetical protein Emin_1164 [Elusimicrobium minutum Pei191]